ncbi:MAG: Pseudogene of conserved hypothetical protein [Methanobrevibacter sp. CfCl-M3]
MIGTVNGANFGGFTSKWFSPLISFNEVVINPTNGTIADALKISDYVLLMPGTYTGDGNTNINISGNKYIRADVPGTVSIDGAENRLFSVNENYSLNLTNIVLTGGSDNESNGGVIFSIGTLNIKGCIIQNSTATIGGSSIYINSSKQDNAFELYNTKIFNNNGTLGAGICIDGGNGAIEDTTFGNNGIIDSNLSLYSALKINGKFNVNITNSTFKNNCGGMGAGLRIVGSSVEDIKNSKAIISNSLFQNNEGIQSGAGLLCNNANVSILNSKFCNNKIDEKYDEFKLFSNGAGVYTSNCELNIKNSEFRNNSALYGSGLCNEKGTNTTIENCNFVDNVARGYGAGMVVLDGNLDVKNSNFVNNSANMDTSIDDNNGGGIYLFNGNINVDNSTFKNNHANHGAGLDTRFANVNIKNSLFDGNSAVYGGGLYSRKGNINLESSVLSNNSVSMNGGGVYNLNGSATIDNCNISSNVAVDNGGGLDARYGSYNIKNSLISHNTGKNGAGAYVHYGNLNITSSNVSDNSGEYGAGLCCEDGNLNLLSSNISSNRASLNAAGSYNINGTVLVDGCTFEGNVAVDNGGGLDTRHGNSYVVNSKFINNNASQGGGFYTRNGVVTVNNTVLSGNVAIGDGGAINNNGLLTVERSSFNNNKANVYGLTDGGGAIRNNNNANIIASQFINNSLIRHDYATNHCWGGGAITVSKDANINISDSNFINNDMAISVHNDGHADIKNSCFTKNNGRALTLITFSNVSVVNSIFESNTASDYGGAISNNGILLVDGCKFLDNSVMGLNYGGGAIANWNWFGNCIVKNSVFTSNKAVQGGAIYNDKNTPLTLINNVFTPPVSKGVNDVYQSIT